MQKQEKLLLVWGVFIDKSEHGADHGHGMVFK